MIAIFGYVNCLKIRAFRGHFGFLPLFLATRWHRRGKNKKIKNAFRIWLRKLPENQSIPRTFWLLALIFGH